MISRSVSITRIGLRFNPQSLPLVDLAAGLHASSFALFKLIPIMTIVGYLPLFGGTLIPRRAFNMPKMTRPVSASKLDDLSVVRSNLSPTSSNSKAKAKIRSLVQDRRDPYSSCYYI